MAVIQHSDKISLLDAVSALIANRFQDLSDRYKARAKEAEVRAELMRYTDRELADIGLSRYQVETMDLSENA